MVVGDVRPNQPSEVALPQDDDVIEELSATAPDPALRDRVLPGTSIRRAYGPRSHRLHRLHDGGAEDAVSVKDQIPRRGVEREGFAQLLDAYNDPNSVGPDA